MRNTIIVSMSSVLLLSGSAFAADLELHGQITPVCEVVGLAGLQSFGSMTSGQSITANFDLVCNDYDGATISLTTAEGGLESDDQEDLEIEYTATLTVPTSSFSLTLNTGPSQGNNDDSVSDDIAGSVALANGVNASITATLDESATFAGGYNDTLQVSITAL